MKKRAGVIALLCLAALLVGAFFLLDVPHWQGLDLTRLTELPEATVLYDRSGAPLMSLYASENRRSLTTDEIPERIRQAFVAIEDARFYSHHGVDVKRIFGALRHNLTSGWASQGASTITQQLIKLTHLSAEKTLSRKAQEAYLALCLERKLGKDEILTAYLNVVYFGGGAYGIASAAESCFGKTPAELTLAESALLAGVVKSPVSYAPQNNPDNALRRRSLVLDAMVKCGFVTQEEADAAKDEPLRLREDVRKEGTWYGDAALEEAARALGVTADEIYTGGYAIYTTIDAKRQRALDELIAQEKSFPPDASDGTACEAAFVSVENSTGAVLCLSGGRKYEVQRGLNRAIQMRRQPGSTLKPISVYAAAIDLYGYTPVSLLSDLSREFAPGYTPGNAGGQEHGTVTLRQALSRSMNLATLDLATKTGIDSAWLYAKKLGLALSEGDRNLALALGCLEKGVTPLEVCGAYSALADGGTYKEPYLVERICGARGNEAYRHEARPVTVLKEASAAQLISVLETAAQEGTAKALGATGLRVAGKTGTVSRENGGNQDIWTVAVTPGETCAVWMGFDRTDDARHLPEGTVGGGYPARLAASYLKETDGGNSGDFQVPGSLRRVSLDAAALRDEGKVLLAAPETPESQVLCELLPASQVPAAVSDLWCEAQTPDTLTLAEQEDGSALLSLISLDRHAEYRLMRRREGEAALQIAALRGERGAYLTFREDAGEGYVSNIYWVIPVNVVREKYGAEGAQGKPTGEIVWAGRGGPLRRMLPEKNDALRDTPAPDGERSLFAGPASAKEPP